MRGALRSVVIGGTVLTVLAAGAGRTHASPAAIQDGAAASSAERSNSSAPHVRGTDAKAAALLDDGYSRSATFQGLVDTLERLDVVVWVGREQIAKPGQLVFVGGSRTRYLRITLRNVPALDDSLIAWLGHELQHAVEIASAPDVRTSAAVREFYRRYGLWAPDGSVCTEAAQRTTVVVGREIARGRTALVAASRTPGGGR